MGTQDKMMYSPLAYVYDLLSYDFDYDEWANWYEKLITRNGQVVKEICDVGCGTGEITIRLCKKGYKLTGVDLSGDMLCVASDKARKEGQQILFSKQDMRSLKLAHKVDAIICACDGVNYLHTESAARAFLRSAKSNLRSGGTLAFDISNKEKLLTMASDRVYAEENDDCAYLWQNELIENEKLMKMDISLFIRAEDGRYDRYTESHKQRLWSVDEIEKLLTSEGYTDLFVSGKDDGVSDGPGGKRAYFCARTKSDNTEI